MPANGNIYRPLDESQQEIRLVRLLPAAHIKDHNASVPLILDMTVASLSDPAIKYNAVSYVWGEPNIVGSVAINGHDVDITENLYLFLLQYRALVASQTGSDIARHPLWVDALCINQSNITERNHQTQRMGDIYSLANLTFAWLGEGGSISKLCLQTLSELAPKILDSPTPTGWLHPEQAVIWRTSGPDDPPAFWRGLHFLLTNSYWQRTWVVQEIILSRNTILLCGDAASSLEALWKFYKALRRLQGQPRPSFIQQYTWDYLTTKSGPFLTLCAPLQNQLTVLKTVHASDAISAMSDKQVFTFWKGLILQCMHLKATDVRDKLYSLLGFMHHRILPDYALSAEAVYTDFAKQWMNYSGDLTLLRLAGHFQLSTNDEHEQPRMLLLSSWVPNWDKLSCTANAAWLWSIPSSQYGPRADTGCSQLNSGLRHSMRSVDDGRCLQVSGVRYSSVSDIHSCSMEDGSWLRYCQHVITRTGGRPYMTGIPILQALARLLFLDCSILERRSLSVVNGSRCADTPPELVHEVGSAFLLFVFSSIEKTKNASDSGISEAKVLVDSWRKLGIDPYVTDLRPFFDAKSYKKNARNMFHWNENMYSPSGIGDAQPLGWFLLDLETAMEEYVAVTTTSGHLGWCRRGVNEGDIIAVVDGCPMPVILRSVNDSHHILVGSAFIFGLMHGEAVEAAQAGKADVESFRIW